MRTLLATAIFLDGIFALNSPADAARKYKRSAERHHYAPYYYVPRREAECARARHEDRRAFTRAIRVGRERRWGAVPKGAGEEAGVSPRDQARSY